MAGTAYEEHHRGTALHAAARVGSVNLSSNNGKSKRLPVRIRALARHACRLSRRSALEACGVRPNSIHVGRGYRMNRWKPTMAHNVRPIPEGYHTATPYLICNGAAQAIDFYKRAFGATEIMRMPTPDGKLAHAEIKIGDSHIMLADESPEQAIRSPQHYGGTPVSVLLYVESVDTVFQQAVSSG